MSKLKQDIKDELTVELKEDIDDSKTIENQEENQEPQE